KLKSLDQIDVAAVAAALEATLQQGGQNLEDCVKNPSPACLQQQQALIQQAATAVITELVDPNADIAWVAPFCLLGDNGEGCGGPTAAEAVPGEPAFTG